MALGSYDSDSGGLFGSKAFKVGLGFATGGPVGAAMGLAGDTPAGQMAAIGDRFLKAGPAAKAAVKPGSAPVPGSTPGPWADQYVADYAAPQAASPQEDYGMLGPVSRRLKQWIGK